MHEGLFTALSTVKWVEIRGGAAAPEDAWSLSGSGTVEVDHTPATLLLREKGSLLRNGLTLAYHTSWRFENESGTFWLGHARHDTPFRLLELIPAAHSSWVSPRPHLCGADVYEARITLLPNGATQLDWQTRGPKKNHLITRIYSSSRPPA